MISVIVPCFNATKFLTQCLESLLHQTYGDLQIICVDDGSTDATLQVLKDYGDKDSRIQILSQLNTGISGARNAGLELSVGEYIAFVDADDWLEINTFERIMQHQPADVICFSYYRNFEDRQLAKDLGLEGIFQASYFQRRIIGLVDEELENLTSFDALTPCWGKLYRKNIIGSVRFRDLKRFGTWEDGIFNVEVLQNAHQVAVINHPLYHYRKTPKDTYTTNYKADLYRKWKNKFLWLNTFIDTYQKPPLYKTALANRICVTTLNLAFNEMNSGLAFRTKAAHIKNILHDEMYVNAFKSFSPRNLPVVWKIFYYFAKIKNTQAVTLIASLIYRFVNRKKG